ncbi:MAG: hypothetical protein IPH13_09960 [Planctomycetes bacterium]|nr:hypothetical protein [Planctomycetota bacterium]MCC7171562.1 hypothetical protein [Planctomycetota bacterium]
MNVCAQLFLLALCVVPISCSDEPERPASKQAASSPAVDAYFGSAALDGAVGVLDARTTAGAAATELTVRGRVKDFVDGAAVFTLIDASLKACGEDGEDDCKTPWDYCCHDPAEIAKATVTVELREGATPIATSLDGVHGLAHLKPVTVHGTWSTDAHGNATLVARTIQVP